MALVVGVNSYATVAEANTYFEDRLDVAAWQEASDDNKSKALVTAASMLENLNWIGTVVARTQKLAHPRIGWYRDPRLGMDVQLDSAVVDQRVITASFELAYHLINNDGLLDDTGLVSSIGLGDIQLTKLLPANKLPNTVRKLVAPLLERNGNKTWWRSN